MVNISKEVSKHLFISNLRNDNQNDNNLYTKIKFIINRQITKKCEENKNGR